MSYDITFCEGEGCPRREQCHRYCQLLRFRADTDPDRKDYISMCKPNPNKCTLFWSEGRQVTEKAAEPGEENCGKAPENE